MKRNSNLGMLVNEMLGSMERDPASAEAVEGVEKIVVEEVSPVCRRKDLTFEMYLFM